MFEWRMPKAVSGAKQWHEILRAVVAAEWLRKWKTETQRLRIWNYKATFTNTVWLVFHALSEVIVLIRMSEDTKDVSQRLHFPAGVTMLAARTYAPWFLHKNDRFHCVQGPRFLRHSDTGHAFCGHRGHGGHSYRRLLFIIPNIINSK